MTHRHRPGRARAAAFALAAALAVLAGCATPPPPPTQATPPAPVLAEPPGVVASAPAATASDAITAGPPAVAASAASPASAASAASAPPVDAGPRPEVRDPLRPDVHIDLDDASVHSDLWARIRRGFAMPDLDNARVRSSEQWYASRPDYVQRMTERGGRYLFHILEEVDRRGLPTELALLPFIESAFNPRAQSVAKASGMWQFIPSTGRTFDLAQNVFRDERRDVLASTRAALDYLTKLHGMFGDWHLALAAYNWGEGNVQRAMLRNQRAGRPTDYERLRMPAETANYVPKLQAVKNIVMRPEQFGLTLPPLDNHPYFIAVPIERDIDVELAARLAGLPLDEFHALNPQLNKPVILAAGTPQVLLPYDEANRFVKALNAHRGPLASWTAWVAPKTLRPAEAARTVGMDEAELREVNRIPARMLIKAGSTLLVPRNGHRSADVPEAVADNAVLDLAAESRGVRRVVLKAGRNDSVASVARRYKVSANQLAKWNRTGPKARFTPGQSIIVLISTKPGRTAGSSGGRARKPAAASRKSAPAAGRARR